MLNPSSTRRYYSSKLKHVLLLLQQFIYLGILFASGYEHYCLYDEIHSLDDFVLIMIYTYYTLVILQLIVVILLIGIDMALSTKLKYKLYLLSMHGAVAQLIVGINVISFILAMPIVHYLEEESSSFRKQFIILFFFMMGYTISLPSVYASLILISIPRRLD